LVKFGLERLAQRLGVPNLSLKRLILTAHSGGGAPLLKILQHIDPHEIHVFDGLYQSPNELIRWAKKRITQDLNAISGGQPAERYMTEHGGSLRVVYFRSPKARRTETNSLEVLGALKAAIPVGSELAGSYRVERTKVRHCDIPKNYAWRLLADSRAELPELYQPKASTKKEFYTAEEAPFADAELEDSYLYEDRYTESFEPQDEEEGDLEPSPEQYETSQPLTLKGFLSSIKRTKKLEPVETPVPLAPEIALLFRETTPLTYTGEAVTFPSGETLPVVTGLAVGEDDDYWDPTGSGNPLLDTGPAHKDKKLSKNFTVRELTSSGGVSADISRIDPKCVECLQRLRDHIGKDVKITSGFRSWKRNKEVYGGKKPTKSQHCAGRAADIRIAGMNGLEIGKAAIDAYGPHIGVGLGNKFAHVDVRGFAAAWNYGGVKDTWIDEIKRYQKERGGLGQPSGGGAVRPKPGAAKPAAELVRFAQRVLNAAQGERLDADGDLGQLTRGALERFRKRYGLGAGGVLDGPTELALAQRALEEIAQQSIFAQLGVLDAKTKQALAAFKSERQLGFDPTLDVATRAALTDALARRTASLNRPTLDFPAPVPPTPGRSTSVVADGAQVSNKVIAVVERYRPLVEAAAATYVVDSALIRGVIAAESGGDKDLVAKSGYTGLMQAGKGEAHKRPETSINAGTKKLRDFRVIMGNVLKEHGRRYDQLPEAEQLRLLALAYNAGPVTVAKALQYAAASASPERWLDPEHYKRALLFTGGYSLKQAAARCLKDMNPSEKDSRMREAVGVWNQWRLGTKKTNWRKLDDPPPWPSVSASLPPFVVCAINFKHDRSPKYAAKILAYRDRFKSR
jgi:soluble lytic murein transglycosylase-like protein